MQTCLHCRTGTSGFMVEKQTLYSTLRVLVLGIKNGSSKNPWIDASGT